MLIEFYLEKNYQKGEEVKARTWDVRVGWEAAIRCIELVSG